LNLGHGKMPRREEAIVENRPVHPLRLRR
jgi:hypothetical protein